MFTKHLHRRIGLLIALSLLWVWPQEPGGPSAFAQVDQTTVTYDATGNLATRTDANGAVTTYKYDVVDQLTEIGYADGTGVTFEYDALGRRTKMRDALGETRYDYDFHGRVSRLTGPAWTGHRLRV